MSNLYFTLTDSENNARLDKFISLKYPQFSRAFVQKLIDEGCVIVNGKVTNKASLNLKTGYNIKINFPEKLTSQEKESLVKSSGIELLYEHEDFLIIYKPAGVLTHPNAEKNEIQLTNTLSVVDWLEINYPTLRYALRATQGEREKGKEYLENNRPGIVHRLDFLTSGIMLIARNQKSFETFTQMFKERKVKKTYLAIVKGNLPAEGEIDFAIVQKPGTLKMMCVKKDKFVRDQKEALTKYKVIKYFKDFSLVEVNLITGRTHQIRVHFAAIGHPVLGDELYGKTSVFAKASRDTSNLINRQALHAYSLEFEYKGEIFKFSKDIPEDMKTILS